MTPELSAVLESIQLTLSAHSLYGSSSLSTTEYDRAIQSLAFHPDLRTLTAAEWQPFYARLPDNVNVMSDDITTADMDSIAADDESTMPDIMDVVLGVHHSETSYKNKPSFIYRVVMNASLDSRSSFLPLVPILLTYLVTQHMEDTNEDDISVINAIENVLNILIPHANDQDVLHEWYTQCIKLFDVSPILDETAYFLLSALAYQIVSQPQGRELFKPYLDELCSPHDQSHTLSDNQHNAIYRGYAVIAIEDPRWGWDFFKQELERSLPLNDYPQINVTQIQTLISLIPLLSPDEQLLRWHQMFDSLQTSSQIKTHARLCNVFVNILSHLVPYLAIEHHANIKAQIDNVISNPSETKQIKTQMQRLSFYCNNENSYENSGAAVIDTVHCGVNLFREYAHRFTQLDLASSQVMNNFFYMLLTSWREISKTIEINMQHQAPHRQEDMKTIIHDSIKEVLFLFGKLFPHLKVMQKREFWSSLRTFLLSGFHSIEVAGQVHMTVVYSLNFLAPQLLMDSDRATLSESITAFCNTLRAAMLCLSHTEGDNTRIPHIMQTAMHKNLVAVTINTFAAAMPYIPAQTQWKRFRQEMQLNAAYSFINYSSLFKLALDNLSPFTQPTEHFELTLSRLHDGYHGSTQDIAQDLLTCILRPHIYERKSIWLIVRGSLLRFLTHFDGNVQQAGLSILKQWIELWVRPLLIYRGLQKQKIQLPAAILASIACHDSMLILHLLQKATEQEIRKYFYNGKTIFLDLQAQLIESPVSPTQEQAIACIRDAWPQQQSTSSTTPVSQTPQAFYNNASNPKKRKLGNEIVGDNNQRHP